MKNNLSLLIFFCALLAGTACAQQQPKTHFDGKTWWNFVSVLADDKMEGRETGSAGLRNAEAYIVDQLKSNGLEPAGVFREGATYQVLRQADVCPKRFPRRDGVPAKRPLF